MAADQRIIGRAVPRVVRERVSNERQQISGNWSDWVLAMTPQQQAPNFTTNRAQATGNVGFRRHTKRELKSQFEDIYDKPSGIYEWRIFKRTKSQEISHVVYIGCTCRNRNDASIIDRVWEYCLDGSHKKKHIIEALKDGYELWVRIKVSAGGRKDLCAAEEDENQLLRSFDYAWNIRGVDRWLHPQ